MTAATSESLARLHSKLAQQFEATLDADLKDNMPTDAATLSVIKSFLKDNNITCDPADRDQTDSLQEKFKEQARIREERKKKALAVVAAPQTGT